VAVIATLEPAALTVDPGGQASLAIKIRNQGAIVDRFDFVVVGPLAQWARVEPTFLSLFPGQDGEARLTFAPPRAPFPRAGSFPFGVQVRAAAEPTGGTVEEGRVTLGPFTDAAAEIVPATSRGSKTGRHDVLIDNRGNAPVEVVVGAVDPDRLVDFQVQPDRLVIGPGERASVSIRGTARDTFWTGSKVQHPFNVEIRPGSSPVIPLRATLLQGPLLPRWVPIAGGLALAGLIAVFALARMGGSGTPITGAGTSGAPSATPSQLANASASASLPSGPASGDASAPASGAGGGGGSPTPEPSPTPGPFVLTVVGDQIQTGGALAVKCPPEPPDSQCLKDALDNVRALTTSMQGPFGGGGIVNPQNTSVAKTLPIVMSRDVPFAFIAQDGQLQDQTDRIVIDLAPLLATPPSFAYAVVDSAAGPRRFVLPDALARQLLNILYDPNPSMVASPEPGRTIPPFFTPFNPGDLVFQFQFSTPAP
jgi:hypothetical protein